LTTLFGLGALQSTPVLADEPSSSETVSATEEAASEDTPPAPAAPAPQSAAINAHLVMSYEDGQDTARRGMQIYKIGEFTTLAGTGLMTLAIVNLAFTGGGDGFVQGIVLGTLTATAGIITVGVGGPIANMGLKNAADAVEDMGGIVDRTPLKLSWASYVGAPLILPAIMAPQFMKRQLTINERAYLELAP
jgi:hypothetical protein